MKTIYVAHSSNFDFQTKLYQQLREISNEYTLILPHEHSDALYNSKEKLKHVDAVIAEVSYPSTGMGIELGWANFYDIPIICIHKTDTTPSSSLNSVSDIFIPYDNTKDVLHHIRKILKKL